MAFRPGPGYKVGYKGGIVWPTGSLKLLNGYWM